MYIHICKFGIWLITAEPGMHCTLRYSGVAGGQPVRREICIKIIDISFIVGVCLLGMCLDSWHQVKLQRGCKIRSQKNEASYFPPTCKIVEMLICLEVYFLERCNISSFRL